MDGHTGSDATSSAPKGTTAPTVGIDALLPAAMAHRAEDVGVAKAATPAGRLLALSILAGAFIGLGAMYATVATSDPDMSFAWSRVLGGVVFSLGLVLVVVGGAELFTGNALIVIAVASRRVRVRSMARNWSIVLLGNALGALAMAALVVRSGTLDGSGGAIGRRALSIGVAKTSIGFDEAIVSGVIANVLVCLAVWMTLSARSVTDRVLVVILPVSAFVAGGFEHSVANMYLIPTALMYRSSTAAADLPPSPTLSWTSCLVDNLIPVVIGNVIGGSILVGATYWFVYLRHGDR
jgi:formate transporter